MVFQTPLWHKLVHQEKIIILSAVSYELHKIGMGELSQIVHFSLSTNPTKTKTDSSYTNSYSTYKLETKKYTDWGGRVAPNSSLQPINKPHKNKKELKLHLIPNS